VYHGRILWLSAACLALLLRTGARGRLVHDLLLHLRHLEAHARQTLEQIGVRRHLHLGHHELRLLRRLLGHARRRAAAHHTAEVHADLLICCPLNGGCLETVGQGKTYHNEYTGVVHTMGSEKGTHPMRIENADEQQLIVADENLLSLEDVARTMPSAQYLNVAVGGSALLRRLKSAKRMCAQQFNQLSSLSGLEQVWARLLLEYKDFADSELMEYCNAVAERAAVPRHLAQRRRESAGGGGAVNAARAQMLQQSDHRFELDSRAGVPRGTLAARQPHRECPARAPAAAPCAADARDPPKSVHGERPLRVRSSS
jgi:hypothetical protein